MRYEFKEVAFGDDFIKLREALPLFSILTAESASSQLP